MNNDLRCIITVHKLDAEDKTRVNISFPGRETPDETDVPYLMIVYASMLDKIAELTGWHWVQAKRLLLSLEPVSVLRALDAADIEEAETEDDPEEDGGE